MESFQVGYISYFSNLTDGMYPCSKEVINNNIPLWTILSIFKKPEFNHKAIELSQDFEGKLNSLISEPYRINRNDLNVVSQELVRTLNTALLFEKTIVSRESKVQFPEPLSNFKFKILDAFLKLLDTHLQHHPEENLEEMLITPFNQFLTCTDMPFSGYLTNNLSRFPELAKKHLNKIQPDVTTITGDTSFLWAQNASGDTPIHKAIKEDVSPDVVLSSIKTLNKALNVRNKQGNTIYHLLALNNLYSSIIVEVFLNTEHEVLSLRNIYGFTPIEYAIKIQKGLIPIEKGRNHPFDEIAITLPEENHLELIDFFSPGTFREFDASSILRLALEVNRSLEVLNCIIDKGGRNTYVGKDQTIFHLYAVTQYPEKFKTLLGSDIVSKSMGVLDIENNNNCCALEIAMQFQKDIEILTLLLHMTHPSRVYGKSSWWFHLAVLYQSPENLKELYHYFPVGSLRTKNSDGKTPLHVLEERKLDPEIIHLFKLRAIC